MKLTTSKKLVVARDLRDSGYFYCDMNFFKLAFNDNNVIPVLYTDDLETARNVVITFQNRYIYVDKNK